MSNIDYLIEKVVVFYLNAPIDYIMYDDVFTPSEEEGGYDKNHYYKRHAYYISTSVVKVKDITFFGFLVQPHRSMELVNIEFNKISRISRQYKELLKNHYSKRWEHYSEQVKARSERFIANLDKEFIEWDETPNTEPREK